MFISTRRTILGHLIRRAKAYAMVRTPIPLDIYAALYRAGVDIEELERNARNGKP